jgi:hypothetical protein
MVLICELMVLAIQPLSNYTETYTAVVPLMLKIEAVADKERLITTTCTLQQQSMNLRVLILLV